MSDYTADHAGALLDVQDAGAALTFSHVTAGTYDAATDTTTGATTTTVSGYAIRTGDNPVTFQALGLVLSEAATLLFTPSTYGELPSLGDTVTWNSLVYSVRQVKPLAPDGNAILGKIVVSR